VVRLGRRAALDGLGMRIGYFLSSEEFGPKALVEQARLAEQAGFAGLWISDHFHPWTDAQGESPFVWSVIGAIAEATERIPVTTAVTCPTLRIHPAVIAQAAATSAVLLDGRFLLGVGSGEALNEHILGDRWPSADIRLEMLEEAVAVMRDLWDGGMYDHRGGHYEVENARIYTLPDEPPKIIVSGFGPKAVDLAARVGDGYCATMPDTELVQRFRDGGGAGKLTQAGTKVCWGPDEAECRHEAYRLWPNEALPGELAQGPPHAGALRAGDRARHRGDDRRVGAVRAGHRAPRRRAAGVRRRRVRRALRAADRQPPRGVLRDIRARGAAALLIRGAPEQSPAGDGRSLRRTAVLRLGPSGRPLIRASSGSGPPPARRCSSARSRSAPCDATCR
jgi:G6PDH family F420-dependent oxidoreductase